jgi:hypothetical protein
MWIWYSAVAYDFKTSAVYDAFIWKQLTPSIIVLALLFLFRKFYRERRQIGDYFGFTAFAFTVFYVILAGGLSIAAIPVLDAIATEKKSEIVTVIEIQKASRRRGNVCGGYKIIYEKSPGSSLCVNEGFAKAVKPGDALMFSGRHTLGVMIIDKVELYRSNSPLEPTR